jgi:3-hydroxyisobutyrate dehydrogenase-like beta-hydroxyacid dehydrogenase
MDVGVIGLGHMGAGMAASLLRAGHRVTVWNRSPDKADALVAKGAVRADTPAQAFAGEAAISMLADDRAVRESILEQGVLEHARPGFIHLSASTISVEFAEELESAHARARVGFLSTPVFGRPSVAEAGQLNVLAAGDPALIERARPVLDAIGKAVWPVGELPHQANVVKLCGNFTLACAIEAMAEAFTLARKWDVDPGKVAEVLTGTLFDAPAYKIYAPLILEEKFEPAGFKLKLGLKDVREAQKAGEARAAPMPFASVLRDAFVEAVAHGDGDKDWSALSAVASRRAGLSKRT